MYRASLFTCASGDIIIFCDMETVFFSAGLLWVTGITRTQLLNCYVGKDVLKYVHDGIAMLSCLHLKGT